MKVRDPHFRLERIRKYIDEDIFPTRIREAVTLNDWKYIEHSMEEKLNDAYLKDYDDSSWQDFHLYDSWGGYDKVAWFRTKAKIPKEFHGKQVAIRAIVGPRDGGGSTAETLLYVDGHPVQAVDIWHEEAFLDASIYEGKDEIQISLKSWSGVLDIPRVRVFKEASICVIDPAVDKFFFTVDTLLKCLELLKESDLRRIKMTKLLTDTFQLVDFLHYKEEEYYTSIAKANAFLQAELDKLYEILEMKPTVTGVGHSHIDMGWLWRYSATREKASRTFSTVLNLMRQFPEYRYMHTSPQLYKFLKKDYPEIFAQVKEKINEGQWEITGGMWVEPDTNLPTGESLIRQFLFGKRYIKEEFGKDSKLVWLPDVFGYSGALPQIMKKSDMDYFMTTKISWNQYNHFPYDTFIWKGIDGSEIFTHFITTPEDGSWFYTYNGQMEPNEIPGIWENYKDKDKNDELLIAFGWGDGGGGPTKDMLERARVMKNIPGIPRVQIDTTENYFKRIYDKADKDVLGVWDGELYFEFHRGTYTSQAKVKRDNRKTEVMMHNLEFLWSLADMLSGTDEYPKETINEMWEDILLNQFHDVLPGSSIRQVYEDTDKMYAALAKRGNSLLQQVSDKLCKALSCKENEILVANPIGWERNDFLLLPYSDKITEKTGFLCDGQTCKVQKTEQGVLVYLEKLAPYGCKKLVLTEETQDSFAENTVSVTADTMENKFFKVSFDENGQIASIWDKKADREVGTAEPMNRFQAFEDKPQRFDAWDIDVYYKEKPYPVPKLMKREIISTDGLEGVLRFTYEFNASVIIQDVVLYGEKDRIDFRTQVDWKEKQVLLRVFFPVDVHAANAAYEIQCGNIERPTHTNNEWDFAKFEVCAQKWVDLSDGGYGVALLNDCKYGHDIHGNTMAITLIKSAVRPDETADRRHHEFVYSLYPHRGTFRESNVQQSAMELNLPLVGLFGEATGKEEQPSWDKQGLVSVNTEHLVVDTIKRCEDEKAYILRLYEYKNKKEDGLDISLNLPVKRVVETNLIERELKEYEVKENQWSFDITGYEIKTFKIYVD